MEDIKLWLWYTMAMANYKTSARELYDKVKSIEKIYQFTRSDYKELGLTGDKKLDRLCDKSIENAEKTMWFAQQYGVEFITCEGEKYPEMLSHIKDYPLLLYKRGVHFKPNEELYISVIGTSNPSKEGMEMAYNLGRELAARGVTVVGGMSKGIEMAAHKGCLDAGGKTLAVMVGGVNHAPQNTADFMRRVLNNGSIISEYGFEEFYNKGNYAQRNRIIAAISHGTVMVEASEKSNSLLTAKMAVEYNKDLFVVPGQAGKLECAGSNELLKEGAKAVTKVEDILEEYETVYPHLIKTGDFSGYDVEFDVPESNFEENNIENTIIMCLKGTPKRIEELLKETGLPISALNGALTLLELKGEVEKDGSSGYYRAID